MNRQKLNEKITKEFETFKAMILELSKEEIFNKGFEIDLYSYFTNYLTDAEIYLRDDQIKLLENFEGSILATLYDIYMNNDYYFTYEDMCDEIIEIFTSENQEESEQE